MKLKKPSFRTMGLIAIPFFLLKGLLWLAVPVLATVTGCPK